jgi:O-antigen/teichoic acid export membrane protein
MSFKKSLSIYTLSSLINSSIPFLLLPILTNYLTPEDYGLLAIIQIFIIFIVPFISINITTALQLKYHNLNKEDFAILVSSVLLIPFSTIFIVLLIFILSASLINLFLNISILWILTIPLISFMQVIPQVILTIYLISEESIKYGKFQILLTIINFTLTIILVSILKLGWEGRVLAILFSYTIFTIISIFLLKKMNLIILKINKEYILEALKLGSPLILHVISATLFMMSDRLFISYYLGNSEVGIYVTGVQVAMIALIIQESFNQAWVPYLFKHLKTNTYENNVKIVKISYIAFGFFLLLPFIVYLLSFPIFQFLINDKFIEAQQYVFWVALGFSFLGMYKVVTNYIFYEKRTGLLSLLTFTSLCMNLILNYLFINLFGTIGVAYATALTILFFFILVFIIANKIHTMPWLYFIRRHNND